LLDLIGSLQELSTLGVGFVSLCEALDLTTPSGRALAGMLAVFAEYAERAVMRSRELDPVQNTARFLTVSNVMSVWRATHNPGPFSQESSRPARTGCAPSQAKQSNPCYGPPRNP